MIRANDVYVADQNTDYFCVHGLYLKNHYLVLVIPLHCSYKTHFKLDNIFIPPELNTKIPYAYRNYSVMNE